MERIPRRQFLEAAAVTAAAPLLCAAAPQGPGVSVDKDVVYGKGGDIDLRLDVYRPPAGREKRIATVHLHGGGFTGGSKDTLKERVSPLVELGYIAVVSQYRLAGQAKWPAQLDDVKAAVRWVRTNAGRLDIDPDRIVIAGYSAGGFLALSEAAKPETGIAPAACIAFYPADVSMGAGGRPHALLPAGSDEAAHRAISLAGVIGTGFPATILFQGTADTTVPLENTQRLFQRLLDLKVRAELHTFEGQPHIFDNQPVYANACARLSDLFLQRVLSRP